MKIFRPVIHQDGDKLNLGLYTLLEFNPKMVYSIISCMFNYFVLLHRAAGSDKLAFGDKKG